MKNCLSSLAGMALILAAANLSLGQPVVDGTAAGDLAFYGAARSVQNTNSGFGNATNGDLREAFSGSEIDQVFGAIAGDRLYVLVTGNLENNFNKLEIFIDSEAGGMNQLDGSNLPPSVDPFCCPGEPASVGALQQMNGLRFDTGFSADHYVTFSNGDHTFGPGGSQVTTWTLSAFYADLTAGTGGQKSEVGFQYNPLGIEPGLAQGEPIDQNNNGCSSPQDTNCNPPEHEFAEPVDTINDPANNKGHRDLLNDVGFLMAINNSNTQGVNFGFGAATGNPQDVVTGIEFSLPLSQLGNPTGAIKLAAFINNGGHTFVSNQFAGTGIVQGNLGNSSAVNLASIAGDQFVTITQSADFDRDADVDSTDLVTWEGAYSINAAGDSNGDGVTDGLDLLAWQTQHTENFGNLAAVQSVPEPETALLFVLIGLPLLGRASKTILRQR